MTDKYLAGELNFSSFVKEMKYDEGDRDSDDDSDKVGVPYTYGTCRIGSMGRRVGSEFCSNIRAIDFKA